MKILYYAIGKEPEVVEINNSLQDMQDIVGGYIETVPLPSLGEGNFVLIVNEEGMVHDLPVNRGQLVGNMFVVAEDEEDPAELRGLKSEEVEKVKQLMDAFLPAAPSGLHD